MMLAPILRRLDVQVHLGEVVQREYADHADDDCGEHDLRDGPVLKEQLADEHVEFSHAAFLQEEAKRQTKQRAGDQFGSRGHRRRGLFRRLLNGFARINHGLLTV